MKYKPVAIFIFIYIAVASFPLQVSGTEKLPVAVFSETEYRFASVLEGDDIAHDFIVQNIGNAPLVIESVRTD